MRVGVGRLSTVISVLVVVSSGCYDKNAGDLSGLNHARPSLTVLEGGKSEMKALAGSVSGESLLPGS